MPTLVALDWVTVVGELVLVLVVGLIVLVLLARERRSSRTRFGVFFDRHYDDDADDDGRS